jgi:hypothetical protein
MEGEELGELTALPLIRRHSTGKNKITLHPVYSQNKRK